VTGPNVERDGRLRSLFERGRAAHPGLELDEAAFNRCLEGAAGEEPVRSLESLVIEDLYLACACAQGIAGAAAVFESRYASVVRRAVSRVLPDPTDREEAAQRTRHHLLVGTTERNAPNISKYRGHGPLENWVSVAAIRVAVSFGRSESSERRLRKKLVGEAAGADPELLVMKGELREQFETAVQEALQQLSDRERLILRLYLVSGMTLAAIGESFGVTHPTVARWLVKARDNLLKEVQHLLESRLKLSKADMVSIARLVASQIDISLSRLLANP
jgi:RNA polymerase sigma-70 factor, ECF subfamily